jgi:hypothetical protein
LKLSGFWTKADVLLFPDQFQALQAVLRAILGEKDFAIALRGAIGTQPASTGVPKLVSGDRRHDAIQNLPLLTLNSVSPSDPDEKCGLV